ncbi:hypothetical protein HCN44_001006 [Aphidius gifuensis]|uniref:Amino acid transporter transmembrane domain-containing protein n=1 Tax=Aphidius gifuensis TaxID=684658 RepID=A0A834XLF1_APHGI|nr:hypothetical protein HCN44_001006 [Aphidius gifuensis]
MELDNYSTREKKDAEVGFIKKEKFDPFTERKVENPTTDGDTLTHLLKACLGTGILSMPCAFRSSGLALGIISTIVISFICTYCAYILVKCAHVLYYRTIKTQMSYADVAETALKVGPKPFQIFAKPLRIFVDVGLFVTQFGVCIAFAVIVATNFKQVVDYYQDGDFINIRYFIAGLLIPLVLLTLIPDLKKLAPVSMIANIFMLMSLLIISYWLIKNLIYHNYKNSESFQWIGIKENQTLSIFWYSKYSQTFSITIFAIEAIGIVMPLENKMKSPKNFIGPFGVLSQGMILVTIMYIIIGLLGYLFNPISEYPMITLEMPMKTSDCLESILAQAVRILVGLAVFFSFCLQFFVCLDIAWSWIRKHISCNPKSANYILRISLVTTSVFFGIICPEILPLIGLIGACCLSILGLLVPVIIETITYWNDDTIVWRILRTMKNIFITIIAALAFYYGTSDSLNDIRLHLFNIN